LAALEAHIQKAQKVVGQEDYNIFFSNTKTLIFFNKTGSYMKLRRIFLSCFIATIITAASFYARALDEATIPTEEQSPYKQEDFTDTVTLQLLNKITARSTSLDILAGKAGNFGTLEITLVRCWKSPQEEDPESKALLKISEQIPGEGSKVVFHGWMFASTPALSTLEHAVYDVTVITCKNSEKASKSSDNEVKTPEVEAKKTAQ
jgi:hypothetical protein